MRKIFVLMVFITLTGSYNMEAKAASTFDVVTELFSSKINITPPKFTKPLKDVEAELGETVTLTAEVTGEPAPEIKVYKDGVEITSSQKIQITWKLGIITIIIKDITWKDEGEYSIVATNIAGTARTSCKLRVIEKL